MLQITLEPLQGAFPLLDLEPLLLPLLPCIDSSLLQEVVKLILNLIDLFVLPFDVSILFLLFQVFLVDSFWVGGDVIQVDV